ncbi:MAG: type II toxin-antitoxin system PemK/MazF family toxin [Chloroflexi bacterium]|nr:type II toxin-antitoxin system PemK/MazF family toxin [Chloroflexota bacterium]
MPSSTRYDPGTVVAVRIRFSDGVGIKRRPAVVVSHPQYHVSRADAVVIALTTQMHTDYYGDCDIIDWRQAGLPAASRSKGVIQTIERRAIEKAYGALSQADLARLQESIREILWLGP